MPGGPAAWSVHQALMTPCVNDPNGMIRRKGDHAIDREPARLQADSARLEIRNDRIMNSQMMRDSPPPSRQEELIRSRRPRHPRCGSSADRWAGRLPWRWRRQAGASPRFPTLASAVATPPPGTGRKSDWQTELAGRSGKWRCLPGRRSPPGVNRHVRFEMVGDDVVGEPRTRAAAGLEAIDRDSRRSAFQMHCHHADTRRGRARGHLPKALESSRCIHGVDKNLSKQLNHIVGRIMHNNQSMASLSRRQRLPATVGVPHRLPIGEMPHELGERFGRRDFAHGFGPRAHMQAFFIGSNGTLRSGKTLRLELPGSENHQTIALASLRGNTSDAETAG